MPARRRGVRRHRTATPRNRAGSLRGVPLPAGTGRRPGVDAIVGADLEGSAMADPTRVRTRLGREARREQIVDAAAAVFQRRDPAEVTFEEIADAAGVSRALVYNYFGDRNGVLEAVYRRNLRLLRERIGAVLTTNDGFAALHA